MTETQFLVVISTIYIAPHINKWTSMIVGIAFGILASIKGLTT